MKQEYTREKGEKRKGRPDTICLTQNLSELCVERPNFGVGADWTKHKRLRHTAGNKNYHDRLNNATVACFVF